LRLEDHRAEHGLDPASPDRPGLPLVYRGEWNGDLLYSVGPDRVDDGGEGQRMGKNRDLVWRVERLSPGE
jgi:hypothetical protein